jgi:hypothetical protein
MESEVIRTRLEEIRIAKKELEKELDWYAPDHGRILRCATRHWSAFNDVYDAVSIIIGGVILHDVYINKFADWIVLHNEYEQLITMNPEIYDEIRNDRFRRALEDAKHWKL